MSITRKAEWSTGDELPTPGVVHELLKHGVACSVNGHKLRPDEHGVWITNPYGVDGLWQDLTLPRVEKFLADMEAGKEYGLVP